MSQEKDMHRELQTFTKTCKEKQKNLNDGYKVNYNELLGRHKKHLKNLYKELENKKKTLRKKLEKELTSEFKARKKHNHTITINSDFEQNNADSTSHLSAESSHNKTSRLNLASDDQNTIALRPHSTSGAIQPSNGERQSRWALRHTKKNLAKSEHSLNRLTDPGLAQMKIELEERYRCAIQDSRNTIAENEWKFLLERQQLRRSFAENLGDLKQRRLMALADHSRMQIKGYFEIQRKWLNQQHHHELEQRNQISQQSLKRLGNVQSIERQTAYRIAKLTAKGQKQMFRALKVLDNSDDGPMTSDFQDPNASNPRNAAESMFAEPLFPSSADQSPQIQTRMITQAMPQTYGSMSVLPRHQVPDQNSPVSLNSRLKNQAEFDSDNRDLNVTISTSRGVVLRKNRYRTDNKSAMRRARSAHSLQSTVSAYDNIQRSVLNVLSSRQTEQWSDVIEQEHSITDMLIQSHTGQIKALIASESAALKRAQIEQDNKSAYLAITLEANQRFMEKEFEEERNRMIQFYFSSNRPTRIIYSHLGPETQTQPPSLVPPSNDTINGSSDVAISAGDQISPSISIPIDQYTEPIRRPASSHKVDKSLAVTTKLTNQNGTIQIKSNRLRDTSSVENGS